MALKKSFLIKGAATIQNDTFVLSAGEVAVNFDAIIKVISVVATKDQISATVQFSNGKSQFAKIYAFTPDMDGSNFIAQAYEHLKTLLEFADAEDC